VSSPVPPELATPAPTELGPETTRLMLAVRSGQAGAFEELESRLRARAFRIAHALVGSLELAQESFLKVYGARETFRPGDCFLPWFHRILRNTCYSFLRRRGRLRARSLSDLSPEEEADYDLADPSDARPEDPLLAGERVAAFQRSFQRLSARDREILVLRHFQELSYREIADSLGVPQGTVMSRLFHARRRLREALGPELSPPLPVEPRRPAAGQGPA
jgi:RNA polymerase sigma-70 factor (ECF subfamily)